MLWTDAPRTQSKTPRMWVVQPLPASDRRQFCRLTDPRQHVRGIPPSLPDVVEETVMFQKIL